MNNMTVYVGVSRKIHFLDDPIGTENYWCVSRTKGGESTRAQVGDLLLMYFPVSASAQRNGIAQFYRIVSQPSKAESSECSSRRMLQVRTVLLCTLSHPVTAQEIKANQILSKWSAVGRNFQAVTFALREELWQELRRLIIEKNPDCSPPIAEMQ